VSDIDDVEVLLVEDSRHDAELMMRALAKCDVNSKLHWVQDGVDALEFIRCTGAYDGRSFDQRLKLVLLDLKMPRLNGLDVMRELKSDERTKTIPIVVMTSSNETRDIRESYQLGANGYVTKPIQSAELAAAIAHIAAYWLRINQVP